jgi:hypothetical protein
MNVVVSVDRSANARHLSYSAAAAAAAAAAATGKERTKVGKEDHY